MSRRRPPVIRNKGVIAAARRRRVSSPGERLAFRVDPLTRRLIRPLLVALLATSVAIAMLVILRITSPEIAWLWVAPLSFLCAIEGAYTAAWLSNPGSRGVERGTYRATELLLLLVLIRIYTWVAFGQGLPSPDEMRLYLTAPVTLLTVGGFLSASMVSLVAWWLAVSISRTFVHLDVSYEELNFFTLSSAEQKDRADDRPIQIARDDLQQQYLRTWLTGGMFMVIAAALSTYEVNELTTVTNPFEMTRLGLSAAMLYGLLIYFLSGFWLLSHARLLRMNALWLIDGVAMEASLERGWQRSAMVVLLAIALAAAFLPIGSTLAISRILSVGLGGVAYLAGTILRFFGYLFASVLLLLTRNAQELPSQPQPTPSPIVPPTVAPPPASDPLLTMVISSAFWALMIAFVIGSFLFFLRERGYRIKTDQFPGYWSSFITWLREEWARITGRFRAVRRDLQSRLRSSPPAAFSLKGDLSSGPRRFRLGGLSPREQVRFYYLSLVRRASERGVGRRAGETPLEYAQNLEKAWPDAEGDIEELTQAFLEARYSRRSFVREEAMSIRERWNRLRSRLRAR